MEIDRISSRLALPRNVQERANAIYKKMTERKQMRGRPTESVATAALYAACREHAAPWTMEEILQVTGVSKKEIWQNDLFIARELSIHPEPMNPISYVPRFCSKLNLSETTQAKAIELLKKVAERGLISGYGPAKAAAAIYIAGVLTGERRTQLDVAGAARVTDVTIRNYCRKMSKKLDSPADWKNRGAVPSHLPGGAWPGADEGVFPPLFSSHDQPPGPRSTPDGREKRRGGDSKWKTDR